MPDRNNAEKFVDAFEDLVNFVHRKPKASLGTLAVLFIVIGLALMSYSMYVKIGQGNKVDDANQTVLNQIAPDRKTAQKLLKQNNDTNIKVDAILKKAVTAGADRAFLMKFHNGTRDINGVHFMYVSTTNEQTQLGIQNVMASVQDIPTAVFDPKWISAFLDNKCVEIKVKELDKSNAMNMIMNKLGITQMHICPIYDIEKGYLLGLSGVSWVGHEPTEAIDKVVDTQLFNINMALESLMTPIEDKQSLQ